MGIQNLVLVLAVFASSGDVPESEPSQVAVMPLTAKRIPVETAEVLDEILLNSIHRYSQYRVIGASDINSILGLERMKDVVGCDDTQCAVEIGGALGVEYLLAGAVSRLGEDVFITLKLVDIRKTQVIGRGQASVRNDENLFSQAVNRAAQEVLQTGTPGAFSGAPRKSAIKEVIELDGPMFQRFLSEGIDKNAYIDYVSSKLSYPIWARKHNRETESLVLEISKWVCAGTVALIGGVMLGTMDSDDDWGRVIIPVLPMAITTISLFAVDIADIGNVPRELEDFN